MPGLTLRAASLRPILLLLFMSASFLFGGCVSLQDPEASQENRPEVIASVEEGQSFGQSFISRRPGLNGIQLWLSIDPGEAPNGTIIAELFHAPGEKQPIAVVLLPLSEVARTGTLRLEIHPQAGTDGQGYYLSLKTRGVGIRVFGRGEDVYPEGQAYANGLPLEADAAFRLSYHYGLSAVVDDLSNGLVTLWTALPLAITLLMPGWLLLELSGSGKGLDSGEKTGLAAGLSLAAIPLVMLWTSLIRWPWSQGGVIAAGGVLCTAAAWRIGANLAQRSKRSPGKPAEASSPELEAGLEASAGWDLQLEARRVDFDIETAERPTNASYPVGCSRKNPIRLDGISLALFGIFLFSLSIRLIMVRDLAVPAWVDSVHHALITRLIVEQGSFPATYEPYLELDAVGYHPGFHSLAATFHWLSGLEIPSAMLLLGQVLNALSVYATYLFTTTLVQRRTAGLIAALIAGVFTPMPAYYTSWGRYTQLAGLLILPAALALTLRLMRSKIFERSELSLGLTAQSAAAWKVDPRHWSEAWRTALLSGAAIGGLFLVHYRVLAFLVCLLFANLACGAAAAAFEPIWKALRKARNKARSGTGLLSMDQQAEDTFPKRAWPNLAKSAGALGLAAFVSVLLTLPWWPDTLKSFILPKSVAWNAGGGQVFSDFSWSYLDSGLGKYTLILAGLGFIWGILRRHAFIPVLTLWVGLLFTLANPGALGLPGTGLINNTSVEISLFLPIALLGGYFISGPVDTVFGLLPRRWRPVYSLSLGIACLGLALIGARQLIPILNPVTLLFREVDRPAINWIQDHLPVDASFLINPFSWGYGLYAGNDGGFWITPLTGRRTLPPPVLYGFDNRSGNIIATNDIIRKAMEKSSEPADLHSLMKTENIGYIFVGRRGGIFSPHGLQESGLFDLLYKKDGVWIFQAR